MFISNRIATVVIASIALIQPSFAAAAADNSDQQSQDAAALPPEALGAISAGEAPLATVATRQNVDAMNGGNTISADTLRNGDVDFSSGAFGGFSGVGNIVVNTGNNNIIQGTLSVTIVSATPH